MDFLKSKEAVTSKTSSDLLMFILRILFHSPAKQEDSDILAKTLAETSQKTIKNILDALQLKQFSISLIEKIEGCYPILKQVFHISITSLKAVQPSDDLSVQISRTGLNIPPEFICFLDNLQAKIGAEAGDPCWDAVQRNNVKYYSCPPVQSQGAAVSVEIETCSIQVKPKIVEQNLGLRPRLFSFEVEDLKDVSLEKQSPDKKASQKQLSIIKSESFYEEDEIGFKLLNSTLPDILDSEEEELSQNIFDLDLDAEEYDEDTRISLYVRKCVGVSQLNIFNDLQTIEELLKNWVEKMID